MTQQEKDSLSGALFVIGVLFLITGFFCLGLCLGVHQTVAPKQPWWMYIPMTNSPLRGRVGKLRVRGAYVETHGYKIKECVGCLRISEISAHGVEPFHTHNLFVGCEAFEPRGFVDKVAKFGFHSFFYLIPPRREVCEPFLIFYKLGRLGVAFMQIFRHLASVFPLAEPSTKFEALPQTHSFFVFDYQSSFNPVFLVTIHNFLFLRAGGFCARLHQYGVGKIPFFCFSRLAGRVTTLIRRGVGARTDYLEKQRRRSILLVFSRRSGRAQNSPLVKEKYIWLREKMC